MSSQRPARRDADSYPAAPLWAQNGTVAAAGGGGGATNGDPPPRLAVPKMGVRARIADWPPKRDAGKEATGNREATANRGFAGGHQPLAGVSGFKALHRLARRRSKEVEFHEGWPRSPARGLAPLRHRSSSEVTLSECDGEETAEARGATGLYREYGSTSSIDVQGISEQSFYELLNGFRAEKPERGAAPVPDEAAFSSITTAAASPGAKTDPAAQGKDKARRRYPKSGGGGDDSIFKKLRGPRADGEASKEVEEARAPEPGKAWVCQKSFAHYDVQSMFFDLNAVAGNRLAVAQRRNTTTGASAASAGVTAGAGTEELNRKENLEHDGGDDTSNELLLSCPHFRNEIGGAGERDVAFARAAAVPSLPLPGGDGGIGGVAVDPALAPGRPTNAGVSVLEAPKELQRSRQRLKRFSVEHADLGARYYRDHFHGKEHSNYFGLDEKLGPVAVSLKREKLEDHKEHGPQFQYRLIFRTSELVTLRGSILEDATPTATKPGSVRGLPPRDALEYVVPELNIHCLRLALSTPKVPEQLLKLDEQGLCRRHKVGILYCKAGQSSEEEMYNNEEAGPAFEEFLALLGEKVSLKAFGKYAAQLDTKTDSTGTHSLYTTYQDYEIMFHVSTMLPYTPNNRQQLLRKRHIGNDIVTIIFQEPGALPFTPQNIRSHFQHVFIIVRAHQPCTDNVSYSVAVTRSKDVPPFGPPIPPGITFRRSDLFRDFLLAKAINAENAAHKSRKFHAMATRTRREYLQDLAENYVTNTPIDSAGKFNLISLTSKKKEKTKARAGAEQLSAGAIAWRVSAQDFARGAEISCVLGISNEFVVLLDLGAKEVVFNCFCADVIGWSADGAALKIFYGRGDHVFIRAGAAEEIKEIVQRLKVMTSGCETVDMTLRRNGLGQLGFHVKYDGTVAEVEDYGFAWQAGLRQGSRLVEICKVAVVTLSHEQMIDLLRTSVTVKVVIVPPHDDGTPRRGLAEGAELAGAEVAAAAKGEAEAVAAAPGGQRPPYRSSAGWQWSGPASHNATGAVATKRAEAVAVGQGLGRAGKQAGAAVAYREAQPPHGKRPLSFPETPHPSSSSSSSSSPAPPQPHRQPSGSFSAPAATGPPFARYKPPPDRFRHPEPPGGGTDDSSSGGASSHESTMERHKAEPGTPRGGAPPPVGVGGAPPPEPPRHLPAQPKSPKRPPSRRGSAGDTESPPDATGDVSGGGAPKVCVPPPHPSPFGDADRDPSPPGKSHRHNPGAAGPSSRLGGPPRPPPQLAASVPKSFFSKQPPRGKHPPPPGWKRPEEKGGEPRK